MSGKQLSQTKPSISWQQSVALTGNTMKFEMEFGWAGNESVIITTFDFDKIAILQAFINHCEETGWVDEYEDADEIEVEFDTEEEEAAE